MHKRKFRSLVCSMLLGDGCVHNAGVQRKKTSNPGKVDDVFFCMNHSSQQADYAMWKANLLNNELAEREQERRCTYSKSSKTDKVRNKTYTGLYIKLRWADFFRNLYQNAYKGAVGEKKKYKDITYLLSQVETDLHTAIWFMDDGNEKRKKRSNGKFDNPFYRLFIYEYGEGGAQLIKSWFRIKYDVDARILRDDREIRHPDKRVYLVFSPADSKKLFMRFAEYFCQVQSMRDKFWLSFERYGNEQKVTPVVGEDIVQTTATVVE